MAYVTSAQVAHARKTLKATFPQFKFSVTGGGTSAITVSLMSGNVDLSADAEKGYVSLNKYWLHNTSNEALYTSIIETMMNALAEAGNAYFDESDSMTDYFCTAYYYYLTIGKWNKPYQFIC